MPRGDRTGPMGMGAMTGRAAGYCAGFGFPGYANPALGQGFGMRFGGGRGWRKMFYATGQPGWMRFGSYPAISGYPTPYQKPDPEMEKRALKNQADALQSELDLVKKRLSEIETETAA
jgi:hypothetical protein